MEAVGDIGKEVVAGRNLAGLTLAAVLQPGPTLLVFLRHLG